MLGLSSATSSKSKKVSKRRGKSSSRDRTSSKEPAKRSKHTDSSETSSSHKSSKSKKSKKSSKNRSKTSDDDRKLREIEANRPNAYLEFIRNLEDVNYPVRIRKHHFEKEQIQHFDVNGGVVCMSFFISSHLIIEFWANAYLYLYLTAVFDMRDILFEEVNGIQVGFYADYPATHMGIMRFLPNTVKTMSSNDKDIVSVLRYLDKNVLSFRTEMRGGGDGANLLCQMWKNRRYRD